ncbi:MAG: mechanosensitive ion channel family protein [Cyanobacteriota bacterium]|jgi:small conductance mechanosensitive channel
MVTLAPESALSPVAGVIVPFLFKLAGAAALWFVGGWLIQFAMRFLRRSFSRGNMARPCSTTC